MFCLITREHMHAYCHGAPSSTAIFFITLDCTATGNAKWLVPDSESCGCWFFAVELVRKAVDLRERKVCALAYTCQACLGGSSKAKCFYSMYMVPSSTHCLRSRRTRTNVLGKILQCVWKLYVCFGKREKWGKGREERLAHGSVLGYNVSCTIGVRRTPRSWGRVVGSVQCMYSRSGGRV